MSAREDEWIAAASVRESIKKAWADNDPSRFPDLPPSALDHIAFGQDFTNQPRHTMTDYDRGTFVKDRTITIEPCANGTFVIQRGRSNGDESRYTVMLDGTIAFSSASDMLRFLQSEYGDNAEKGPSPGVETNTDDPRKPVSWRWQTSGKEGVWCHSDTEPVFATCDLDRGFVFNLQPLYA